MLLAGWVAWDLEQEKGGWDESGLGHHMVEEDGLTGRARVWNEDGKIVFEGTSIEEVDAWIESQRNRSFVVPVLLFALGAALLALGGGPSPRRPELGNAGPREEVRT